MRSPDSAPPRPDLGWLRHRRVEHRPIAYVHPPRPSAAPAPGGAPSLDLTPPAAGRSLDLSPATPARRPHSAPSLDLTPTPTPSRDLTPAAPSLDLTPSTAPALDRTPARSAQQQPPRRSRPAALPYPRLPRGTTAVLAGRTRTVTLTRLQSGTGALQLSLSRASGAGDLALGLVLATTDGATSVLQRLGNAIATPTSPAVPLPLARLTGGPGAEGAVLDLRQVGRLERVLVYGYSPSVSVLAWDGLLALTTYDGSRVEVPFDLPPLSGTVALLTAYQVRGELVLRAELEPFAGPPEAAAQAYGFHYGWLDGRLPAR